MVIAMIRTYSELIKLKTFEERLNYCRIDGTVGDSTFGFERYLNQRFYNSEEWKRIRRQVIIRDSGFDLATEGEVIFGKVIVHHMNPILPKDIIDFTEFVTNPEYLVCVSNETHQAIHYAGTETNRYFVERTANDTCPWKRC